MNAIKAFLLFTEAIITSAYVKIILKFLPFRIALKRLGSPVSKNNEIVFLTDEDLVAIKKIQHAVRRCNKYSFWQTECYTQALTGKILLQRRHIKSVVHIGFKKNATSKYEGHAWLTVGDIYITGNNGVLHTYYENGAFL